MAQALRCYRLQDYPASRRELIVADDGEDAIADLLKDEANLVYLRQGSRIPIGLKRNLLAKAARGDILVHMDDDDYYPPSRISHAVEKLQSTGLSIAGASEMAIYYLLTRELAAVGPYGKYHSLANSFAYRREYLDTHRFEDECRCGEEAAFTNHFTTPMVQLDPRQTVVMIAHNRNTYDKSWLRRRPLKEKLKGLISDRESIHFYRYRLPKLLEGDVLAL